MSKRWSNGNMGTLFDFIYHLGRDLDALVINLYVDFSLLFTSNLDFRPLWDPGNAVTNTIELMRCFMCQENHFDVHPQFLVLQLDLINPAMHSTCLQPQMLATGIGIIQHKSRLLHLTVQLQYMRYCFCSNLLMDYVVCMTEMHGFFHDWELCIYEHEPCHISVVGVCQFAATHIIPPLQRLVGLVLITDPMVILTAFGKHFHGEKSVVECPATYLVAVIASLFVSHNTLSQLVARDYKTLDRLNANGLLPLHDLIELASTDFGLNASEMISVVYLEGLLGHAQESIGLPVWSNDGSHGLAGKIQILGTASMIEEPEMIFMEPIEQDQTSKNFSDPQFQEGGSFSAKCTSKCEYQGQWRLYLLDNKEMKQT
ncbi:hypothetical protein ACFX2I_043628 [Malus domestica]